MTVEHIIVAAILGAVLFFTIRTLVRTWRGDSDGGCAGCPGCELRRNETCPGEKEKEKEKERIAK